MSVYTDVSAEQLSEFLKRYDIGELIDFQGISAGVTNTNFFVSTMHGDFVLTLFEEHGEHEIPWYLELTEHLADKGVPSAAPVRCRQGQLLHTLNGKPAALVYKLRGASVDEANEAQLESVGRVLGDLHIVGNLFGAKRTNDRGLAWFQDTAKSVVQYLDADEKKLLQDEVAFHTRNASELLPQGIIHADMFRDNVLISENSVTGVIDFYYACYDSMMYDLAIVANDWCTTADGSMDAAKHEALTYAYQTRRTLEPVEIEAWPRMLRAAALRFWLSRLFDWHNPKEGAMTQAHDPAVFKRILQQNIDAPPVLQVVPAYG